MIKKINGKYYNIDENGKQGEELTPETAFKKIVEDFTAIAEKEKGSFVKITPEINELMMEPKNAALEILRLDKIPKADLEKYVSSLKDALAIASGYHAHYIACIYFYIQMRRVWFQHDPEAMFDIFMWVKEDLFDLYVSDLPTYMYVLDAFYRTIDIYGLSYMKLERPLKKDINIRYFFSEYDDDGYHNIYCCSWTFDDYNEEGKDNFNYNFHAGYLLYVDKDAYDEYDPLRTDRFNNNDKCVDHLYLLRFLVKTARWCLHEKDYNTHIYDIVDKLCFYTTRGRNCYENYYYKEYEGDYKRYQRYGKSTDQLSIAECALYINNPPEPVKMGLFKEKPQPCFSTAQAQRPCDILPEGIENDRAMTYKGKPVAICDAVAYRIYEDTNKKYIEYDIDYCTERRDKILKKRGLTNKLRPTSREDYLINKRRDATIKSYVMLAFILAAIICAPFLINGVKTFFENHPLVLGILIISPFIMGVGCGGTYYGHLYNIDRNLKEINDKLGKS